MTPKGSPISTILLALCMAALAGVAGWWRLTAPRAQRVVIPSEAWEHVTTQYPLPPEPGNPTRLAPELFEAVVRANPFSPQRRFVPPPPEVPAAGGSTEEPPAPPPTFVYKGRIDLGNRKRAIMVDLTTKKTHFLEVGQEVAGFKVLDITETQVLLSNAHTGEELVVAIASKTSRPSERVGGRDPADVGGPRDHRPSP